MLKILSHNEMINGEQHIPAGRRCEHKKTIDLNT